MIRVSQIKLRLDEEESTLKEKIRNKLKVSKKIDFTYHIHQKNIDAREADMIYFVYSIDVQIANEKEILKRKDKDISITPNIYNYHLEKGIAYMKHRPIVVGFGPAGIFSALLLAKQGYCPIVLERGEDVDHRSKSVNAFFKDGILKEESNIQYGEGGAGTFSDGKLTARSKDPRISYLYKLLISYGAPKEIAYDAYPHIGSDKLKGIIKRIRNDIMKMGGTIHFNTKVKSLDIQENKVCGVICEEQTFVSDHVILAIGNSARDTLYALHDQGVHMEAKNFAIGVRIEHEQSFINESLYHDFNDHESLPAASYRLTCKAESKTKGAYTFCMCPGGSIVAATSLKEHVVVNGMSLHDRALPNANSAILVPIEASTLKGDVFAGLQLVDELERKAFLLGGSNYQAPAQTVGDFINNKASTTMGSIQPTYPLGVKLCNLQELFPDVINESIIRALHIFEQKINGFANPDAILTAVETRSSSPVRIVRDQQTLQCISLIGAYPCGEGAGYAGGIISSAIDGMKCAEKIIQEFRYEQ